MIDDNEYSEIDSSIGKEPSEIWTAQAYLRGFARYPEDRPSDLMPIDSKWLRATQRLYNRLPDSDRLIIDSYASAELAAGLSKKTREKHLKYLAILLLAEVGEHSVYQIILPDGESDHDKNHNENGQEKAE